MENKNFFSVQDCENMDIKTIWKLYKEYVNPGQVELISSFGFGRDIANYAEGPHIFTKSGRKILDFSGGIGVLNHGHNHPEIIKVRKNFQDLKKMEVHKNFFSPYLAGLSHNIANSLPGDLNVCYFPNSGAESVEGAVKMAYKFHNGYRKHILSADISFHGKLLGAASLTGSPELDFKFPQIPNVHKFIYNDISSVKDLIKKYKKQNGESDIYALIVEPFNASCLKSCDENFLREIRKICKNEKIVLIFDEIYTGWAKTGTLFYFMRYDNLIPDILCTAKSLGGGKASISGYIARSPIFMKSYGNLNDATLHSTTYNGFGEETVTALQAVNIIIRDKYHLRAEEIFEILSPGLKKIQLKYPHIIKCVRGAGALNGIEIFTNNNILDKISKLIPSKMFKDTRFIQKVFTCSVIDYLYDEYGILTFFGSNREILLIISPTLVTTNEQLEYFLSSLDKTLNKGLLHLIISFINKKIFKKIPDVVDNHKGEDVWL